MPARALVVGADGLIGDALATALGAAGYDVTGTTRRGGRTGASMTHLDLAEPVPDVLPDVLPRADVAFLCAAMTRLADCRSSPGLAHRINYEAPVRLAERLVARGTGVVFLSTSAVLDCREPHMRADRPRDGRSQYGRWKGAAEAAILALGPRASVLRLTKVLTPDAPLFRKWVAALRLGETIEAFEDHRIAPLRTADVVDALVAVGQAEAGGIFQISGARDVSYLDIGRHMAALLDVPAERVIACRAEANGIPPEEKTSYTSLDCTRLAALTGFQPPDPCDLLRAFLAGWAHDTRTDEPTSASAP